MAEVVDLYKELADKFRLHQRCLGQFCGFDRKTFEAMYAIARNVYQQGQYADAERMFRLLCLMDHRDMRFWLGLGASRQMAGDYEGAISSYLYAAYNLSEEPILYFYVARCYMSLGQIQAAKHSLNELIRHSNDSNLLNKAQALLDELV